LTRPAISTTRAFNPKRLRSGGLIFAYVRVSTIGQTTENQIREIESAGFAIEPRRVVSETISGSIAAAQRRGFVRLMDKLETGDILVVTKLDRLV